MGTIDTKEIIRIIIHFMMFFASFYVLSSLNLQKLLLPTEKRAVKAQILLLLLSMALGFLCAQFLLAIMYQL